METRRIQATGGTSLTMTLPKAWVRSCELKAQDRVATHISNQHLILTPALYDAKLRVAHVEITEKTPMRNIEREVIAAFIAGADSILCRSTAPFTEDQAQAIQTIANKLFGFETVQTNSQQFTLKNILDRNKLLAADAISQMLETTIGMLHDALKAVDDGDTALAQDIARRDASVNKLTYAVKRRFQHVANGMLYDELSVASYHRTVAIQIERIADHAVKIAKLTGNDESLSKHLPEIRTAVLEMFNRIPTILSSQSTNEAHTTIDMNDKIMPIIHKSHQLKQSYTSAIIEDSLDRIRNHVLSIAESHIDRIHIDSLTTAE